MSRPGHQSSLAYSPALDGLRAVAILAVLVYHALPGRLEGGFTGVDVFFVLSGYLISSIILHDLRDGVFSLREFYLRRIQRLMPNAALTVLVTVLLSLVVLTPTAAVKAADHGLLTLLSLSNVYIVQNVGGYWGDVAATFPLLHTWSLAVEEQFYLLFPATLWLLTRRRGRHALVIVALLALVSFGLGVVGSTSAPVPTFYLLHTRVWELLLGAGLATLRIPATADRPLRRFRRTLPGEVAGWVGLGLIALGYVIITDGSKFPGVIALLPTLGTLLVLVSIADGQTLTARALSGRPLVAIGKASYSLYLWHWPMIVIGRAWADMAGRSPQTGGLIGAAVGVGLAVLAYTTVERPLRRRGPGRSRRLVVIAAGFSACLLFSLALSAWKPAADPKNLFDKPVFRGRQYDAIWGSTGDQDASKVGARYSDVYFPPEKRPKKAFKTGGVIGRWGDATPRVVVIGSSHGLMYGSLIDGVCKELGLSVAFFTTDGRPVFSPQIDRADPSAAKKAQLAFYDARARWINEWNPDAIVVIEKWDDLAGDPAAFARQVDRLLGELEPHTGRVIMLSQPPTLRLGQRINLREYVTVYRRTHSSLPQMLPNGQETARRTSIKVLEAAASRHPAVQLIRADRLFYNTDGSVRYSAGRAFFYADDDHLTEAGAAQLREPITRALVSACRVPTTTAGAPLRVTQSERP